MVYRITLSSNPKILFIVLIILALPALGVLAVIFATPFFGAIVIAVGGYIDYHLLKFFVSTVRSRVETDEDGIFFDLGHKDSTRMAWDEISHAGLYTEQKRRPHVFIYCEEDDRLMTIPEEYDGFAEFVKEVRENTEFEEVDLSESETINDYLKTKITGESGEDKEEAAEDEATGEEE